MSSFAPSGIPAVWWGSMCPTTLYIRSPGQQTAAMLARHAAHMAEVMGPEHVACGFDFCEYFGPGYEGCEGMEDCGQAQNFFFELERIGFSEAERQAIASENLLRVLE